MEDLEVGWLVCIAFCLSELIFGTPGQSQVLCIILRALEPTLPAT